MKRRAAWITGSLATALLVAGCAATIAPEPTATSVVRSLGSLGVGFYDPSAPPAPEGTIDPTPGSWDAATPPDGYSVILIGYGTDAPTRTLERAVRSWATEQKVTLKLMTPASASRFIPTLYSAIDAEPDLIITVGNAMVDPVAAISAGYLAQQFLVVGAEIAEPTANVTAADWTGAAYRGEGLGTPSEYDPSTFTDERAGRALRAGIAAVVNGVTGIVVWVD